MTASTTAWAASLIDQFEARTTPGTWVHVTRADLAADLRSRLAFPQNINQLNSNLCGMASFVYNWIIDDPVGYVWFAICLFELGRGTLSKGGQSGRVIQPSQTLRASDPKSEPGKELSAADLVVLGSLRDDMNLIFDYNSHEEIFFNPFGIFNGLRGWNTPKEVVKLFQASGYSDIRNYTDWWSRSNAAHLGRASDYFVAGYRIVLLIDYRLMYASTQDTEALVATSNHFVGLTSAVTFDARKEKLKFEVFSNGQRRPIPEKGEWMPVKTLERHYYGFIAANPKPFKAAA